MTLAPAIKDTIEGRPARRLEVAPGIFIPMEAAKWNARTRAALAWPQRITPDVWATRYRYLKKTALPGPWRHEHAPYLRGIMKLAAAPGVVEAVVKKAVQMGVSEALRTLIGYWAHYDPEPTGLALPSEKKGREIVENEIIPLFRNEFRRHPDLRPLISERLHDIKKGQIRLANDFLLHLMWSGSPSAMASNPMKRAGCDEVDKFEEWAGNDADPVSLIEARMTTYPDRLLLLISTPTTSKGMISQRFDQCRYRLYYLVACPQCGVRQRLVFGEGGGHGVKWSQRVRDLYAAGRNEEAAAAVFEEGVHYQCVACAGLWDERQKREAVRGGVWGTVETDGQGNDGVRAGGPIADAEQVARWPAETKLGLQVSSLYCCWESWTLAHVAAAFLSARTLAQKFAFRTSRLGETWADQVERVEVEAIDARVKEAVLEEGVLPRWTARVIAVVDTQADHFWLVIRAWGPWPRSQRIWHGRVESFEDLERWCWRTPWRSEDPRLPARICDKVFIDSGGTRKHAEEEQSDAPLPSRVMDVYAWALRHQAMVQAIKGDSRPEPGKYYRRGAGEFVSDRQRRPVPLMLLDVHHFQDQLADLMQQRVEEIDRTSGEVKKVPAWALNKRHDPEYHRHMAAMHKVTRPGPRGSKVERWEPKREGMRLDLRACEGYQVAAAFMTGVHLVAPLEDFIAAQELEIARRQAPAAPRKEPTFTAPDGRAFVASNR